MKDAGTSSITEDLETIWLVNSCVAITDQDGRSLISVPGDDGDVRLRRLRTSSLKKSHCDAATTPPLQPYGWSFDQRCRVLICVRQIVLMSSAVGVRRWRASKLRGRRA